jgi:hypothetical protein
MINYTVFIPESKGKKKSAARGFWADNGRIYYDYIRPETRQADSGAALAGDIEALRVQFNQLAMFYIIGNCAFVADNKKIEALPLRIYKVCGRACLRQVIKSNIKEFGGITAYILGGGLYGIESWQKENK